MTSTITDAALALSSSIELSILGKATIIIVLGLIADWLAGRARASRRHLLLAATFVMLLALPLIIVTAPEVMIELPASHAGNSVATSRSTPSSDALVTHTNSNFVRRTPATSPWSVPSWQTIVRSGWMVGAMLLFMSLAIDLRRLRHLLSHVVQTSMLVSGSSGR